MITTIYGERDEALFEKRTGVEECPDARVEC